MLHWLQKKVIEGALADSQHLYAGVTMSLGEIESLRVENYLENLEYLGKLWNTLDILG